MTSRDQLQETLCNRLFWHTAERDDAKLQIISYIAVRWMWFTPWMRQPYSIHSSTICKKLKFFLFKNILIHKNNEEKIFHSSSWCLSF